MTKQFQHAATPEELPEDDYLSLDEVFTLHNQLVDQANKLVENAIRAMDELTEEEEYATDEVDIANSLSSRELMTRFAGREQKMLRKIRYVLNRMNKGEYGVCEECGSEIGYRRLEARSVATLCINCKTTQERLETANRRW